MTVDHLKQLIAQGESETLELKKSTGQRSRAMETLCGMLNGKGGAVVFGVASDRLEVVSNGGLHFGITVEDLCRPHRSEPWNPDIAQAFYRRGIIETWGRGTLKIRELCAEASVPEPDYRADMHSFTVCFLPPHVHPRHVVEAALRHRAASVVLVHNHPTGEAKPSRHDHRLTETLIQAFDPLDVKVLDHIIVAGEEWYSFARNGYLDNSDTAGKTR